MTYPKVTFMTASYNDKFMIELTIKSILEQDYPNIEHIIMDSESTDGTIDVIKKYEPFYKEKKGIELKWFSEKDKGIYDAYNKILNIATGDYLIICADPLYNKHVTKTMIENILINNADGCIGSAIVVNSDMCIIRKFNGKLGNIQTGWIPAIPTMLLSKKVFDKYGKYDERFNVSADYEFVIRIFKDKELNIIAINSPLVIYYAGGISNGTLAGNMNGIKWGNLALRANNIKFPCVVDLLRIIRSIWQYRYILTRRKLKLN